jgi:hypothetical protein
MVSGGFASASKLSKGDTREDKSDTEDLLSSLM